MSDLAPQPDTEVPPPGWRCKHFEICGLGGERTPEGVFCTLHNPNPNKSHSAFQQDVKKRLEAGKSDFRFVNFPREPVRILQGIEFPAVADFRDVVILAPELSLDGSTLPHGLKFSGSVQRLSLKSAKANGTVEIKLQNTGSLSLQGATLNAGLTVTAETLEHIELNEAVLSGKSTIDIKSGSTQLVFRNGRISGELGIEVNESGSELDFSNFNLAGKLTFRGRLMGGCRFEGAKIQGTVDFQKCQLGGRAVVVSSTDTEFDPTSMLDLSSAKIHNDLEIVSERPPGEIVLNGCEIAGKSTIEAGLGKHLIRVTARECQPKFGKDVSFTNVDLSSCRLVGVPLSRVEFSHVKWATRYSRNVLYDEIVLRNGTRIPPGNMKEAYQILKEKYLRLGNNATAGDFHYGEMEMRRREYGWPKRVLTPEVLYWALSGYGIGYIRAGLCLMAFIFLFAGFYYVCGGNSFAHNFGQSLLFSFQTSTLQRPSIPQGITTIGRWAHAVEAVVVPLQAALFALALRMRLKR